MRGFDGTVDDGWGAPAAAGGRGLTASRGRTRTVARKAPTQQDAESSVVDPHGVHPDVTWM